MMLRFNKTTPLEQVRKGGLPPLCPLSQQRAEQGPAALPDLFYSSGFHLSGILLFLFFICTGCRREMQHRQKIKPLRATTFFTDRLGSRQPIEGTIPRGYLRSDTEFYTGKKAGAG